MVDSNMTPGVSRQRFVYGTAVLLRIFCVFSMAMIHPDEYFQCPEVMSKSVFHLPHAFIPWEYKMPEPNRSIFFPMLVAGLPYSIWKWLGYEPNGLILLLLPRFLLLVTAFLYDYTIVYLCRYFHIDAWGPLFVFSTSWTTWIFLTRAFSNTFESLMLLISFLILFRIPPGIARTTLLGFTLACGSFTRFTFILFFFPLGLYLVWDNDRHLLLSILKKADSTDLKLGRRLVGVIQTAIIGAVSFGLTSFALILFDSTYFHGSTSFTSLVVAPWNNFIYNMDPSHLAEHGLHPHTNHWLVNMPLLFGPLALCLLVQRPQTPFEWLTLSSVIVPVTFLSAAPHQEARFLLPVLLPLVLSAGGTLAKRKYLQVIWLVFNGALGLWFGLLHQGGLLPLLLTIGGNTSPLCTRLTPSIKSSMIITTGTYMPPRFAMSPMNDIPLLDVPLSKMYETLVDSLGDGKDILLAYPEPLRPDIEEILGKLPRVESSHAAACWPFLSTESFPSNFVNYTEWMLHLYYLKQAQ